MTVVAARNNTITKVCMSGTPLECGIQLGRFGARAVHDHLVKTEGWALVTAYRRDPRIIMMAKLVEAQFPSIYEELKGIAQGLQLSFEDVFAWNCRGDIRALAPDGCTTVMVPGKRHIIAHNEDGDPGFRDSCGLANIAPTGGRAFTAFIYPGSLPGHTFAFTDKCLVMSVNNIRPRSAGAGLPRMVLGRAVLDCPTLDAAISLIETSDRAGAFHFTLGQTGDDRLVSIEFTGDACSVETITAPRVHSNHLVHKAMANIPQIITDSSGSRQRRGDAMVAAGEALRDPLAILRDTAGPGLPIRRDDARDPDDENTLATALIVMEGDSFDCYVYDQADAPACFYKRAVC